MIEAIIIFEQGEKLVANRLRQGLRPHIRIEVKRWRSFHSVVIKARLEADDGWQMVAMTKVPIPSNYSSEWDSTALKVWQELNLQDNAKYRHAKMTHHLSHSMFIFEVEVETVRLKCELTP